MLSSHCICQIKQTPTRKQANADSKNTHTHTHTRKNIYLRSSKGLCLPHITSGNGLHSSPTLPNHGGCVAFQRSHSSQMMDELPCSDARGSLLSATHTHKSENLGRDDILQIEPYRVLYIYAHINKFLTLDIIINFGWGQGPPFCILVGERPAGTIGCIWTVPNDLECHSRSTTCDEACRRVGLNGLPLKIPNLWISARGLIHFMGTGP